MWTRTFASVNTNSLQMKFLQVRTNLKNVFAHMCKRDSIYSELCRNLDNKLMTRVRGFLLTHIVQINVQLQDFNINLHNMLLWTGL